MKSTTLVTSLTRLTTAIAVVAPLVVFGFLYFLVVQPQRASSLEARERLNAARDERNRLHALARFPAPATTASILDAFEARATDGDRVGEVVDGITAALKSPSAGGVTNVFIATGESGDGPIDSMVGPFSRNVWHTPVTVTFDAQYERIGRFFSDLRAAPATFDLRGVEIAPAASRPAGLMRAKVSLVAFHRPGVIARSEAVREKPAGRDRATASARQPDPVVTGILVSGGRRSALIDGRLVRMGDRLPAGVVQSIEPDAVVIAGPDGRSRRLQLARPVVGMQPH
jgi:hypothetical protein